VVNELLRMFPPAPAMFRQAGRDMMLDENVSIAFPLHLKVGFIIYFDFEYTRVDKGTVLAICPFFIHKDPDYWESPNTFMPERFLAPSNW
jgi:cytochrome P450